MDKVISLQCDCGEEVMLFSDDECGGFSAGIFNRMYNTSLSHRLRLIWRVIRYGRPYHDQIWLNDEKALELVKFIKKAVKERNND